MDYPQCSATRKVTMIVDKNNNVEKQQEELLDIADQLAQLDVAENGGIPGKSCIKAQSNNRITENKLKRRVSFPDKGLVDVREYLPESDGPARKRRRLNDESKEKQHNRWCPPRNNFTRNQVQQYPAAMVSNQRNPFNVSASVYRNSLPAPTATMFCYSPSSTPQSRRRSAFCADQRVIHNALLRSSTNQNMQRNVFGYRSSSLYNHQIQQSSGMFATRTQHFSTYSSFSGPFGGIYMRNR